MSNLKDLINIGAADRYPELKRVCAVIISDVRFLNNSHDGLQISVFSFSYKKGYPSDFTGNGGGFMFDCRGMHNPGRYIEYRNLTGRDKPVADFLEERGEVQEFASNALRIVSPFVETYLRRGFSSLQIGIRMHRRPASVGLLCRACGTGACGALSVGMCAPDSRGAEY